MDAKAHLDENRLVDFTEGLLGELERADVEHHLDECPDCRSLVADLVKSDSAIQAPDVDTAPGPEPVATESLALHKGSTLGRYVILDRLGAGGMGVVYAAYDPQLDRKVSLKLLRTDVMQGATSAEATARLLREAQAMARLSHPNVIAVHDVGTIGDQVFFAMEFVDGGTLTHWVKEKPRTQEEALEMFMRAGRGLAAAHAGGLVHRDFKPDNVLVGKDGRVRVTDFGLARPAASTMTPQVPLSKDDLARIRAGTFKLDAPLTQAGALLGTPAYMAPEQLQGRPSDARTDQFSFCVALYEALYGERPLKGDTVAALTMSAELGLINAAPQASRVPERLRRVLLRGLSAAPEERFPSMDALLSELARLPSLARRRLVGGAVALALVAVSSAAAWLLLRPKEPALCQSAERRLAGIWDEARRAEVRAAFGASPALYAAASLSSVERLLDADAAAWVSVRTEACLAATGRAPDEQVAAQLSCLALRRAELGALARLLAKSDPGTIENAVDAASVLPSPSACAADDAARMKASGLEATRQKVAALRLELVEVNAEASVGRRQSALPHAEQLVAEARLLRYRPLEAEALYSLAALEAPDRAEATLLDAARAAEAGHHDEVLARSRVALARLASLRAQGQAQALAHAQDALATIEGLAQAEGLEGEALAVLGLIQAATKDHLAAVATLEAALRLTRAAGNGERPAAGQCLIALASEYQLAGRAADAKVAADAGLAIFTGLYGESHPRTVAARAAFANVAAGEPR